jgi:hypothetical protein
VQFSDFKVGKMCNPNQKSFIVDIFFNFTMFCKNFFIYSLCNEAQRTTRKYLMSKKDLHIKFQVKIIKKNHEKTWILFIKPLINVNLSKDWFVTTYCWTVMKKMGIDTDPNIIRILLCFIFYRNFLLGFFINRICDV